VGLATAKLALERGDKVAVIARGLDPTAVRKELGRNALAFKADVADATSVATAAASVVDAWGGVDVLVNNAGLHRGGKVEKLCSRTARGCAREPDRRPVFVQPLLPHSTRTSGAIINISAVVRFSLLWRVHYSCRRQASPADPKCSQSARGGDSHDLVIPGWIETEMTAGLWARRAKKADCACRYAGPARSARSAT
jgi:NAD(P)-dependent dehydrogenase (short-subunit alcohol dehydrogenase family)